MKLSVWTGIACCIISLGLNAQGLYPVKKSGKWGYINNKGELKIQPKFTWASEFSNNKALVKMEGSQGIIIDTLGNELATGIRTHFIYTSTGWMLMNSESGLWGLMNPGWKWMIEPKYTSLKESVIPGYFNYKLGKEEGIIDSTGNRLAGSDSNRVFLLKDYLVNWNQTSGKFNVISFSGEQVYKGVSKLLKFPSQGYNIFYYTKNNQFILWIDGKEIIENNGKILNEKLIQSPSVFTFNTKNSTWIYFFDSKSSIHLPKPKNIRSFENKVLLVDLNDSISEAYNHLGKKIADKVYISEFVEGQIYGYHSSNPGLNVTTLNGKKRIDNLSINPVFSNQYAIIINNQNQFAIINDQLDLLAEFNYDIIERTKSGAKLRIGNDLLVMKIKNGLVADTQWYRNVNSFRILGLEKVQTETLVKEDRTYEWILNNRGLYGLKNKTTGDTVVPCRANSFYRINNGWVVTKRIYVTGNTREEKLGLVNELTGEEFAPPTFQGIDVSYLVMNEKFSIIPVRYFDGTIGFMQWNKTVKRTPFTYVNQTQEGNIYVLRASRTTKNNFLTANFGAIDLTNKRGTVLITAAEFYGLSALDGTHTYGTNPYFNFYESNISGYISYFNGNWGMLNNEGKWVVPVKYHDIGTAINQIVPLRFGNKWGVLNFEGDTIAPFKYANVQWQSFNELKHKLLLYKDSFNYGMIDGEGNTIIPFNIQKILKGKNNWKVAHSEGENIFISSSGEVKRTGIAAPNKLFELNNGWFAKMGKELKVFDNEGNYLFTYEARYILKGVGNYYLIKSKNNYIILDQSGTEVETINEQSAPILGSGMYLIPKSGSKPSNLVSIEGKWNKKGLIKKLIPIDQTGYHIILGKVGSGLINAEGNMVVAGVKEYAGKLNGHFLLKWKNNWCLFDEEFRLVKRFKGGWYPVYDDGNFFVVKKLNKLKDTIYKVVNQDLQQKTKTYKYYYGSSESAVLFSKTKYSNAILYDFGKDSLYTLNGRVVNHFNEGHYLLQNMRSYYIGNIRRELIPLQFVALSTSKLWVPFLQGNILIPTIFSLNISNSIFIDKPPYVLYDSLGNKNIVKSWLNFHSILGNKLIMGTRQMEIATQDGKIEAFQVSGMGKTQDNVLFRVEDGNKVGYIDLWGNWIWPLEE